MIFLNFVFSRVGFFSPKRKKKKKLIFLLLLPLIFLL